jgi:hypothetical protein
MRALNYIRSMGSGLFSQTWKTTLIIAKYIRRRKWRKRSRRIKRRKRIRPLCKIRTFFLDMTLIPDFVSIDPYCYDYANDNMTSRMVVCWEPYWLKDEPLRRVIKNAVKMRPFASPCPSIFLR